MDVYDFDGTLYRGNSSVDFVRFCLSRHPRIAATLPRTGVAAIACMGLHVIDKTRFKRTLYRFLTRVPDIDREIYQFWASHEHNICGPCKPHAGDLVISASPEFLLRGVCARRDLELIASLVDPCTGETLSPNCSDEEKIARLRERHPDAEVDRFYSDSHNDDPLARIAAHPYMVNIHKSTVTPWRFKTER